MGYITPYEQCTGTYSMLTVLANADLGARTYSINATANDYRRYTLSLGKT